MPHSDLHSSWSGVWATLYSLGSPGDADVQPLLEASCVDQMDPSGWHFSERGLRCEKLFGKGQCSRKCLPCLAWVVPFHKPSVHYECSVQVSHILLKYSPYFGDSHSVFSQAYGRTFHHPAICSLVFNQQKCTHMFARTCLHMLTAVLFITALPGEYLWQVALCYCAGTHSTMG